MDKYSHWLGKFLAYINGCDHYAITLWQTTYYSCPEDKVFPEWRHHENFHKLQWSIEGKFKFATKYIWFNITRGYKNNPYEKLAGKVKRN